ncbi:hypothetical protein EDF22_0636 [Rathayibacter sp. PhB127]|uniref:hypothetical protein n=1 Tax=Rathayibacter sp. PhB127 TaxID=2485176 RepID=UPI000F4C35D3|nr:hypothetical protein [Rathayibacter sp. PhB127]ROS28904.1 hypothetical protein EDF22_0636 [Rathayibacter sp. PhB127]
MLTEPMPMLMTKAEWEAAIEADGGVTSVDDGVSRFNITPGFIGFDHVDMIDYQMAECANTGRLRPKTADAFLDARAMWVALER